MTIYTALYDEMSSDAGIAAAGVPADKIFAGIPPPYIVAPFISYERIDYERTDTLTALTDLAFVRIEIQCWGKSSKESIDVSEAVRALLENFRGTMGTEALQVRSARFQNQTDDPAKIPESDLPEQHRNRMDLALWFRET